MSPSVQLLLSVDIDIFRYPSLCAELLLLVTLKALIGRCTLDKQGKEGRRAGMEEDMEDRQVDGY